MGYELTTPEPENAWPGFICVSPKTHTPGPQVKERGYRYYSPKLGRFISRDPLGELAADNIYTFVLNKPTIDVDPFGLWIYIKEPKTAEKCKLIGDILAAFSVGEFFILRPIDYRLWMRWLQGGGDVKLDFDRFDPWNSCKRKAARRVRQQKDAAKAKAAGLGCNEWSKFICVRFSLPLKS